MNLTVGANSTQTSIHLSNNENSTNIKITQNNNQVTATKEWPEDSVSISDEAKKKLEEATKISIGAPEGSQNKSLMELAEEIKQKTIEDIKERIKELTEELQKLEAQNDENSKEQAKLLQGQINALNGQLLTVMTSE